MKKLIAYLILSLSLSVNSLSQISEFKILPNDGAKGDWFGGAVSISGDYAIVGSPFSNDSTGAAYIFKRQGSDWIEEQKLVASDGSKGDMFGFPLSAISLSGDYAVIGAPFNDSIGAAYIFKRQGSDWIEEQKLIASDGLEGDMFGASTSMSGDYLIIGAPFSDSLKGTAYIFKKEGTSWIEKQKLSEINSSYWFGAAVSISGDYIVVGAAYLIGSAYVYKHNGDNWLKEQKLTASGEDTLVNYFGISVSMSGEYIAIGSFGSNVNGIYSGATYVFKLEGTNWVEEQKLLPNDGANNDYFGFSVSISDSYIIIGSFQDDDHGYSSGSAYIFKRQGSNWIEEQKITASDADSGDWFGISVGVSNDYAIVGAAHNSDNGEYSGSAYIYNGFIVGVENDENEIPPAFQLEQNYPNPFNPATTIKFTIEEFGFVSLKIYDILGNEVATLVDEHKPAATYKVEWNAENLPSGIYFYQLHSNEFIETKKMILMK